MAKPASKHELSIMRVFDAPVSLVFKVWATPEHRVRWWGPKDFTCPLSEADFRRCGSWRAIIRSPDGKEYPARGVYAEIVENRRIVFSFAWEEDGERGNDTLISVSFEDIAGKTRLTFHQAFFDTVETRDSHNEGWTECVERLGAYASAL